MFVLMPFDPKFDDIYKFGIKGAAEDAGAYAERIDDQIFTEGILERVFNQINKADVVVADMTGRNPNVFYEVGYAHALGRIVLLLTQSADDIPFDLKHHQHLVYGGSIDTLKSQLTTRIQWAINESKKQNILHSDPLEIVFDNVGLSPFESGTRTAPTFEIRIDDFPHFFQVVARNVSAESTEPAAHIYIFTSQNSVLTICRFAPTGGWYDLEPLKPYSSDEREGFGAQYALPHNLPILPPGTVEVFGFGVDRDYTHATPGRIESLKLRIHTSRDVYNYNFNISIT